MVKPASKISGTQRAFPRRFWVIKGGLSDFTNGVTVAGQCWTFTSFPHCAPCVRAGGAPFMAIYLLKILIY